MSNVFTLSDYLLSRLSELGIDAIFGVPGDYNLAFLDHVVERPGMDWVGCANELNAAYAADGYARLNGFGVLATTYGVGELSALNGLAGAMAEEVALIEITGAPSTAAIAASTPVHHTFGDGDYARFSRIGEQVTVASAFLNASDATCEIDRVLTVAAARRLPVQLTIPSDIALLEVTPPAKPLPLPSRRGDHGTAEAFRAALSAMLDGAASVALVTGHEPARRGLADKACELVAESGVHNAFLHRGKGVLDETAPSFLGLYAGELSSPQTREIVERADVLVVLGSFFRGGIVAFTPTTPASRVAELRTDRAIVAGVDHAIPLGHALELLRELLNRQSPSERVPTGGVVQPPVAGQLTQASAWSAIVAALRPGQAISAEAGTSYFALLGARLPEDTAVVSQGMWSSIGYTLPAALGAQLADRDRRVVLVIGDGSFQLTAQEIGTFRRNGATPIIVLVNNDGYTVERAVHGPAAPYNDIAPWDWQAVAPALGASDALTLRAETLPEFIKSFETAQRETGRLVFIEAVLPELDIPPLLRDVAEAARRRNGYAA